MDGAAGPDSPGADGTGADDEGAVRAQRDGLRRAVLLAGRLDVARRARRRARRARRLHDAAPDESTDVEIVECGAAGARVLAPGIRQPDRLVGGRATRRPRHPPSKTARQHLARAGTTPGTGEPVNRRTDEPVK